MKKKKTQHQEKNPLHREYGIQKNAAFILSSMIRHDKMFLVLLPIGMICAPFAKYLWTFLSKFIIDLITGEGSREQLLWLMLGFFLVQVISTMLNTYYNGGVWCRFIGVRMAMILKLNRKAMEIDFEHLENPDVMDCFQKARNACGNNTSGVEGMMRSLSELFVSASVVLTGIAILGTMNGGIVVLMVLLGVLNFAVSNHTNAVAKRTVWDPLAPWWRKNSYMQNTTTDFREAKDIRMYGLKDWLLAKYRELGDIRLDAQKRNARLWFAASVFSNCMWLVSQLLVYAWLIYEVAGGRMTVGNFSLYLASSGTFFEYVSGFLNQISGLLARSREVDDYRSLTRQEEERTPPLPLLEVPLRRGPVRYRFIRSAMPIRLSGDFASWRAEERKKTFTILRQEWAVHPLNWGWCAIGGMCCGKARYSRILWWWNLP